MTTVDAILRVLSRYNGVPIRWGKTKKIKDMFIGYLVGASFTPTSRMGGGFNLKINYGDIVDDGHQTTMKRMQKDYFQVLQSYIDSANGERVFINNKRIVIPRTTSRNASTDLELFIPYFGVNRWIPFGKFMPNSVRMLDEWSAKGNASSMSTNEWIKIHSSTVINIHELCSKCRVSRTRKKTITKCRDTKRVKHTKRIKKAIVRRRVIDPSSYSEETKKRRKLTLALPTFKEMSDVADVPTDVFERGGIEVFMANLLCDNRLNTLSLT